MSKSENFAYHVNKSINKLEKSKESALITLERAQKLDLLIHLISNLKQPLVICGAHGIGKTTLLNELINLKSDTWLIFKLNGTENLSFEKALQHLEFFLRENEKLDGTQDLTTTLSILEDVQDKIVFMIDDAGKLVPGLVAALIQYTMGHECLRIVFSLTYDELHIKTSSDKTIEDCHFIEIPPLTEKQCETFLQNLSARPDAIISFRSINEHMIAKLYQITHGVPGKIVDELPNLSNYTAINSYKWSFLGLVFVGGLAGWGILTQLTETKESQIETPKPLVRQDAQVIEINSPVIVTELDELPAEPINQAQLTNPIPPDKQNTKVIENDPPVIVTEPDDIPAEPIKQTQLTNPVPSNKSEFSVKEIKPEQQAKTNQTEPVTVDIQERENMDTLVEPVINQQPNEPKQIITAKAKETEQNTLEKIKKKTIEPTLVEKPVKLFQQAIEKNKTPINPSKTVKKTKTGNDKDWILKQPKNFYTLQLIVLSNSQSVKRFIKQHRKFKKNARSFKINHQGKIKYIVIYGSFKSSSQASKEMKTLPRKYRKSWVRQFKDLQKMIKDQ